MEKELRRLQDIDLKLDELRREKGNLQEANELKSKQSELDRLEESLSEKDALLSEREMRQKKLEGELELLEIKIKKEEDKLYSGKITNPKELQDIQEEIDALSKKKDEMETELLGEMDVVENLSKEKEELLRQAEGLEKEIGEIKQKIKVKLSQVEEESNLLTNEREKVVEMIPSLILEVYEELRAEIPGPVAVYIVEGVCEGCHTELPAEEVDKMMREDKLWQCPYCRRVLIRKNF